MTHTHTLEIKLKIESKVLDDTAHLFAAMSDKSRLRLLLLLQDGERCVYEIAIHENENVKTVSARLKKLFDANLVHKRREAKHIYYRLADRHVIEILENAVNHTQHV